MIRQLILNFEQAGLAIVLWAGIIAALATVILTIVRMKRTKAPLGGALAQSAGEMGIAFSLLAIAIVGFWSYQVAAPRSLNLIPFGDFLHVPDDAPWWSPIQFTFANILLFLPLGVSVQLRFRHISVGNIALGAAALAALIEAWQWIFGTGRVTSTDDVIFNTLGAVLGALIVRGLARLYSKPPPPISGARSWRGAEGGTDE